MARLSGPTPSSKREFEITIADFTIDLARRAGAQYDADRESPPRDEDSVFMRAVWIVYLDTRNARIGQQMQPQIDRWQS